MKIKYILLFLITWILLAPVLRAADEQSVSDGLAEAHKAQFTKWLSRNPGYRQARFAECDCSEMFNAMRKEQPNYQPHYVVGDFNGNGHSDFAIIVKSDKSDHLIKVLVFLERVKGEYFEPIEFAFPFEKLEGNGLFVTRNAPHKLLVGPFFSEAEEVSTRFLMKAEEVMRLCWINHSHIEMSQCVADRAKLAHRQVVDVENGLMQLVKHPVDANRNYVDIEKRLLQGNAQFRIYRASQCGLVETLASMGNGSIDNRLACETEMDSTRADELYDYSWWLK